MINNCNPNLKLLATRGAKNAPHVARHLRFRLRQFFLKRRFLFSNCAYDLHSKQNLMKGITNMHEIIVIVVVVPIS